MTVGNSNQTEVTHVITTHELLPKFKNVLKQTPTVKHLIFIEEQIHNTERTGYKVSDLIYELCMYVIA